MPAPLDVDRQAVKAHAITHGLRAAARAFGLGLGTVGNWSMRDPEGPWCSPKAIVPQQLPPTALQQPKNGRVNAVNAARNSLSELGSKIRVKAARVAKKGLDAAHKWDGEKIIRNANGVKALVDTAEKAIGWANQPQVSTLRLELIAGSVGSADQAELPAIDIEAELLPSNELKGIQGVDEETQDNSVR